MITLTHDIIIIGGGAGGIAVASGLLGRRSKLDVAIIEPSTLHYYQPGWNLVAGGAVEPQSTVREMSKVIPSKAKWYLSAAVSVDPKSNQVTLQSGEVLKFKALVIATGVTLDWDAISGLRETLGQNGVTSNFGFELASYHWEMVKNTKEGNALFVQPSLPMKAAIAPQNAMYLSCDYWAKQNRLKNINVEYYASGDLLLTNPDYLPELNSYVHKYGGRASYKHNLIEVDGPNKLAVFEITGPDGITRQVEKKFALLNVCPPHQAPAFIQDAGLADEDGWLKVDPQTLQHKKHVNIFGIGDVTNTPNAKTAGAARKQSPVVAENIISFLDGDRLTAIYDGYGSWPLLPENGKCILAEFGYKNKPKPMLPMWLLNGKRPSRMAWLLKKYILPWVYWHVMLKGREWLVRPEKK